MGMVMLLAALCYRNWGSAQSYLPIGFKVLFLFSGTLPAQIGLKGINSTFLVSTPSPLKW